LLAGASALQAETGDNAPASFQARRGFSRAYAPWSVYFVGRVAACSDTSHVPPGPGSPPLTCSEP